MSARPSPVNDLQEVVDAVDRYGSQRKAAAALGIPKNTLQNRFYKATEKGLAVGGSPAKPRPEFESDPLPEDDLTVEELLAHRKKQFQRKRAHEEARKLIPVRVKIDGPIGIWHFGDPHIDDDGTDIELLEKHSDLIRNTPGLLGANVGDTQNNWVGRLSHLWAQQSISAKQSWKLAEWFIRRVRWLYILAGNHDLWSGNGDPIEWIMRGQDTPYADSEVRLELQFPNKNICRINARHDFAGHSQYNPAHGPMKASMFGVRDHINIAGHKHISGKGELIDPDSHIVCHCILVASYKVYDRYQRQKGFRDQRISPGVFTLIKPSLPNNHPDFVRHFWDIEEGIEVLQYLRNKK